MTPDELTAAIEKAIKPLLERIAKLEYDMYEHVPADDVNDGATEPEQREPA